MKFSPNFLSMVSWLLVAGIIVLGGVYFASSFFIANISNRVEKKSVKNLSEQIQKNPVRDMVLYVRGEEKIVPASVVKSFFELYTRDYSGEKDIRISSTKVENYLQSLSLSINVQAVNAKFIVVNGRVEEFRPSTNGLILNIESSKNIILKSLINNSYKASLPVDIIEPEITLNKINDLGINTLIGRGESDFSGSPPSRIHNIKVGSAKYNGTILKPGETFSFNSILGEVNERSGYQSELVIKKGKLIYEYGGGLCQVSTTLFRSAIMAGLPILERKPHSFPVRYYNPQGFDATIYPEVVDLKFKNDTPGHILIQSRIEGTKLIFEVYGSADGRKVTLDGPYQYDQKANGSMKAYFVRKITFADGATKEERFDSKYNAPAPLERNPLE